MSTLEGLFDGGVWWWWLMVVVVLVVLYSIEIPFFLPAPTLVSPRHSKRRPADHSTKI